MYVMPSADVKSVPKRYQQLFMLGSVAVARQPMCGIDGNRVPPKPCVVKRTTSGPTVSPIIYLEVGGEMIRREGRQQAQLAQPRARLAKHSSDA